MEFGAIPSVVGSWKFFGYPKLNRKIIGSSVWSRTNSSKIED